MKAITTIQMTAEENQEVARLKEAMGLPTKKAVVMEGLRVLRQILQDRKRRQTLQAVSLEIRRGSQLANREWVRYSTAAKST